LSVDSLFLNYFMSSEKAWRVFFSVPEHMPWTYGGAGRYHFRIIDLAALCVCVCGGGALYQAIRR
jgi:hypothetical protein